MGNDAKEFWKFMTEVAKIVTGGKAKLRFMSSRIGIILLRFNAAIADARVG